MTRNDVRRMLQDWRECYILTYIKRGEGCYRTASANQSNRCCASTFHPLKMGQSRPLFSLFSSFPQFTVNISL